MVPIVVREQGSDCTTGLQSHAALLRHSWAMPQMAMADFINTGKGKFLMPAAV
jgi:hypothetical protein